MSDDHREPAGEGTPAGRTRLFSALRIGLMIAAFATVAVATQYPGFHSLMVYDEAYFIKGKEPLFSQHEVMRLMSVVPVRPLFLLSFYANYLVGGMEPSSFRMGNAVILAGSGLALTFLFALLFELPGLNLPGDKRVRQAVSVFLALLFTVHPLQTFVVLYGWQREAIMGCLFYYAGLAAYVATRSGRFRHATTGYLFTSVLFLLGMLSKENVATLPMIMIMAECTVFRQSWREIWKRGVTICLFLLPSVILYLLATQFLHRSESELVQGVVARLIDHYKQGGLSIAEVVLTECRVFFSYLSMTLFPTAHNVEFMRAVTISRSLLDPPATLAAVAGVGLLAGIGIAARRSFPLVSFGIFFMMISLLPECLLIPQYLFFSYRAILPMAGLLMVVGYGLLVLIERLGRRIPTHALGKALTAGALVLVAALGTATAFKAARWNHISFWADLVDRLPPYSKNVEVVPFLDIAVNCMSTLVYAEKYPEAIHIFQRVLAGNPDSQAKDPDAYDMGAAIEKFVGRFGDQTMRAGGALISLGVALQVTGQTQDAIRVYEKALAIEPHHADVYMTVGALLENSGELAEAVRHYREAIRVDPASALARNCLGNALKKSGDVKEAIQEFSAAVQLEPNAVNGYLNLGLAYQDLGYYREAVEEYANALAVAPESADAHHKLGRAMAETGNVPEALKHYREAVRLAPEMAIAHSDLALALQYSGSLSEAVEEYARAVAYDPNTPIYSMLLGKALTQAGRPKEAVEVLSRLTLGAPGTAAVYESLGNALEKTGDLGRAAEMFSKAIELEPRLPEAHAGVASILMRQGKASDAISKLKTAIELDPRNPEWHLTMGRALEGLGDLALAQEEYKTALRLQPDSVDAQYRLANNLLRSGQTLEAVKGYQRVVHLKPDFADAQTNLAIALLHAGKIPEAIVTLGKALSLKGEGARIFYALGRAFAEMKKDSEAARFLEQVEKTHPDFTRGDPEPDR